MSLLVFSLAKRALEVRRVETEHLLKDVELKEIKALSNGATVKDVENAITEEFSVAMRISLGQYSHDTSR
jgi:hypothetical protein